MIISTSIDGCLRFDVNMGVALCLRKVKAKETISTYSKYDNKKSELYIVHICLMEIFLSNTCM